MVWKKQLPILCILALALAWISPCLAEPRTQAKAHVFARETPSGAEIVFDWDTHEQVPFTIENHGKTILLHFDDPVALQWGTAFKAVHHYLKQMESQDEGTTIILTFDESSKALHYIDRHPQADENEQSGIEVIRTAESENLAEDASFSSPPAGAQPFVAAVSHNARIKKIKEASAKKNPHALLAQEASKLAALAPAAGEQVPPAPSPAAQNASPPVPVLAVPLVNTPAVTSSAPSSPLAPVTIALSPKNDDAFAIFVWQKYLWIVTDSASPPLAQDIRKAGASLMDDVKTIANPHATIYYAPLKQDISASVTSSPAEGTRLLLQQGPTKLTQILIPEIKSATNSEKSLLIKTGKSASVVSYINPLTGETMNVIPLTERGAGIAQARSFVEFTLLPSAQGIAIQRISDKVSVTNEKEGITVAATGGLAISPQSEGQIKEAGTEAMFARLPHTLFPYAKWKLENEKDFVPMQMQLFHDIAFSAPDAANKARLKLLGLYLGEGLFPESLGMANDILRSSLKFYQDNKVSALRGASYLFMYRIGDAERDFSVPELANDPEAAMWRSLCKELLGESKEPFNFSANYDRYISNYPPSFVGKLAIIAADRNINRKQYAEASAIFETLKANNFDEPVKKYIDYMRGKIFSETHEETEATKIWEEQAKDLSDPLIRARAEFSLINMQLKDDKVTHADAIKRLEKLRIVWRGDSLELNVLSLLSTLYLQDKQYAKALFTMRDIVLYYPEVPEAVTTAKQMENVFVMLYGKGSADDMPPLDALALFYEFRDLVPLGDSGDTMVRNLADRLVNIDLLDRAAQLLDHQIRNRLEGEERSRIGTQLAHVYLLNHQPDKALDVLKMTGYGELKSDLQLSRLRLTAQALAQQGKAAKAIEVINGDNSSEGTLLRLSIYWDNKDWQNVVVIAEDFLGNRNDPSAPLNATESDVLLKLATAYVYEHETGQLQYLRDYFTPLMKNNPTRSSFLFITSESGAVDYDNLAALDQEIGEVKSFLKSSDDKPGKNGLSKAAN